MTHARGLILCFEELDRGRVRTCTMLYNIVG
jgi:hypothetical protein